jgi:hypothetical protein
MWHRSDHLDHGRMPACKGFGGFIRPDGRDPIVMRPAPGALDDREEIDVLSRRADRIVQEMRVWSHPELQRLRARQRRQIADGNNAAEGACARIGRVFPAGDEIAHRRPHPIRANENIDFSAVSVSEVQAHNIVLLGDANELVPEVQPLWSMRSAQNPLQVGPVDAEKGRAKSGAIGAAFRDGKRRDTVAVTPSAPDQFARFAGLGRDRLETAEAMELACSVGGERDRRADLPQL